MAIVHFGFAAFSLYQHAMRPSRGEIVGWVESFEVSCTGVSAIGGHLPEIPERIGASVMIDHPTTIRSELRPITVVSIRRKRASIRAIGIHTPDVPIATSI